MINIWNLSQSILAAITKYVNYIIYKQHNFELGGDIAFQPAENPNYVRSSLRQQQTQNNYDLNILCSGPAILNKLLIWNVRAAQLCDSIKASLLCKVTLSIHHYSDQCYMFHFKPSLVVRLLTRQGMVSNVVTL